MQRRDCLNACGRHKWNCGVPMSLLDKRPLQRRENELIDSGKLSSMSDTAWALKGALGSEAPTRTGKAACAGRRSIESVRRSIRIIVREFLKQSRHWKKANLYGTYHQTKSRSLPNLGVLNCGG